MQMVLKRMKKEEKGFTLIELLAVIVILAVIAVIAIPLIGNIINNSRDNSDLQTARQIYDAARLHATAETGGVLGNVTLGTLQSDGYLEANLYLPSSKVLLDPDDTLINVGITGDTTAGFLILHDGTDELRSYTRQQILQAEE